MFNFFADTPQARNTVMVNEPSDNSIIIIDGNKAEDDRCNGCGDGTY